MCILLCQSNNWKLHEAQTFDAKTAAPKRQKGKRDRGCGMGPRERGSLQRQRNASSPKSLRFGRTTCEHVNNNCTLKKAGGGLHENHLWNEDGIQGTLPNGQIAGGICTAHFVQIWLCVRACMIHIVHMCLCQDEWQHLQHRGTSQIYTHSKK